MMTRILFIDDDVLALQLMSKATGMLGFQAITSTSPRSGLELAAEENPSLIMVDMMMDEMDGQEFVSLVRHSPRIAHLPVLIFSASSGCIDEEKARKAGADGFLPKPLGLGDLFQAIQTFAVPG